MFVLTRTLLRRVLKADPSLVMLPRGVQRCEVFRDVVTLDEEERVYAELSLVLQREGQALLAEGSTPDHKVVRHTYLEMFGDKDFTEVKNWQRKEVRRLPGLQWAPTLQGILQEVAHRTMGSMPDTARVLEHNIPGYEMHIEHPTVGSAFIYLNLLSDTVLTFDDEATERRGAVLVPARALMLVAGEARWGFRFGEAPEEVHTFMTPTGLKRQIETDLRLSVQLWKLNPNLLDSRMLQERVEESIDEARRRLSEEVRRREEQQRDEAEANEALQVPGMSARNAPPPPSADPIQSFMSAAMEDSSGRGTLGGDMASTTTGPTQAPSGGTRSMAGVQEDYDRYKKQFANVHGVLQDMKAMQDAGQPINDMWLKKKMSTATHADPARDKAEGFDPNNVEGTWDTVDAKARYYKAKLKTMDYDGTAYLSSRMPDVSGDAPLDMRTTIRKMAPHVKDGEKALANLPQSR